MIIDQKQSDLIKRLNAIRHENAVKQKQVEELQTRYNNLVRDVDEAVKTDTGESDTSMVRYLKIFILFFFQKK